jgi:uncharacterized Fe-S cluster protein YjdI/CDGSH-type Zn-finger protein
MPKRTYSNGQIEVLWDSSRCVHVGWCSGSEPEIFDTARRPWVNLEDADTEAVVAVCEQCPSGALSYRRLDGGPQEAPDHRPSIVPWPNGPLMVRGEVELKDRHGEPFPTGYRFTLCRCGASKNHPFCDLSHRDIGFRNYPRAVSEDREAAESPKDVGPHFEG